MAWVVKRIKPQRLRVDKIRLEILNALRAEGRTQVKEYEKTTASWKGEKPAFESLIDLTYEDASVLTGPTGSARAVQKWRWLDEGTKPPRGGVIVPRRKKWLRFRAGYRAKTSPRRFSSRGGGPFGDVVFAKRVRRRKGIKARLWTETLAKRRRKPFTRAMIKAMQRAASKMYG